MPTTNPRITVTLAPSLAVVLRRLAELAGNSQSALVGDLLAQSQPVFERMVRILEAAKRAAEASKADKDRMLSGIAQTLESMQGSLEQQLGLGLDSLDGQEADLVNLAERIERRAGRGVAAPSGAARPARRGSPTPMSNRGVTPHANKGKRVRNRG